MNGTMRRRAWLRGKIKRSTDETPHRWLILTLGAVAASSIFFLSDLISDGYRIATISAPTVNAVNSIKIEINRFRYQFEKLIEHGPVANEKPIWSHLSAAEHEARALLAGGEGHYGHIMPLENPALRERAQGIDDELSRLREAALGRLGRLENTPRAAALPFQAAFSAALAQTGELEIALQRDIATRLRRYRILALGLMLSCILIAAATGRVFMTHNAARESDEKALRRANAELNREITLRKRLAETAQFEQKRAEQYLNISGTIIVAINTDRTVALINQTGRAILGYGDDEIIGADWVDTVVPYDQKEKCHEVFSAVLTGNEPAEAFRGDVITSNGERRTIEWRHSLLRDEDGLVSGCLCAGEDVTDRLEVEESLHRTREHYRELIESSNVVTWEMDLTSELFTFVSPHAEALLGYPLNDWYEEAFWRNHIHPDDRDAAVAFCHNVTRHNRNHELEYRMITAAGGEIWLRDIITVVPDADGPKLLRGFMFDITTQKKTEENLRQLSQAVIQNPSSTFITNANGVVEYVNPAFEAITGYKSSEIVGQTPRVMKSGATPDSVYKDIWTTIKSGAIWQGELNNRKKDGTLFWTHTTIAPIKSASGDITHFVAIETDITTRKTAEERLKHQANYDTLTDLPNRVLAVDRLSQALTRAAASKHMIAVMMLDLDHFKKINDTLGHDAGDALLLDAAARLQAALGETDTLARLGGDEFLIILPDIEDITRAGAIASAILDCLSEPFDIYGRDIFVSASLGVTIAPGDGEDAQVLMRNADAAMYRSKERGRNTYSFFQPEMNERAFEILEIETRLRTALEKDELFLEFQPIVDINSGTVVAAEALLRWRNPELGLVPPDRFIAIAEATGFITPIGEWILRQACTHARLWVENTSRDFRIAVNVSSRQFAETDFVQTVAAILQETDLPAENLEIEVTESLLLEDSPHLTSKMHALSRMGVHLSIDDFGTGYSSLSYLRRYPFNVLKIDRSFVHDVTIDDGAATLASAIIAMAQNMGLRVIGEGVETREQRAFLCEHGCDMAQGYYFGRPADAETLLIRLRADQEAVAKPKAKAGVNKRIRRKSA